MNVCQMHPHVQHLEWVRAYLRPHPAAVTVFVPCVASIGSWVSLKLGSLSSRLSLQSVLREGMCTQISREKLMNGGARPGRDS